MAVEKKMSMNELLQKSLKQLVQLRNDLRKQLFEHKLALSLRKLNQPHLIALTRRNIARINTAMKQR
jgi:ribosomal protein L29